MVIERTIAFLQVEDIIALSGACKAHSAQLSARRRRVLYVLAFQKSIVTYNVRKFRHFLVTGLRLDDNPHARTAESFGIVAVFTWALRFATLARIDILELVLQHFGGQGWSLGTRDIPAGRGGAEEVWALLGRHGFTIDPRLGRGYGIAINTQWGVLRQAQVLVGRARREENVGNSASMAREH
jgi:hypothetical protein